MPNWLAISLGIDCALWTVMQVRMTLIYMGVLRSAIEGSVALVQTSIRSGLTFAAFSLIFFLIPWPQNLVYVTAALISRALIDLVFFWRSWGMSDLYAPGGAFAKARPAMYAQKIGNIVFFAVALAVLSYFVRPSIPNLLH